MKKTILLSTLLIFISCSFAQKIHLFEDFNTGVLPATWTNNAISGLTPWQFGINGATVHSGNTNINGTPFAYFDDDNLGATSLNNTVELLTPIFDNTGDSITTLEFDYNFRQFGTNVADSFIVEVFDGSNWVNVFFTITDDCGNYITTSCANGFPHANIDISAYANTNCQVRFTYHDGNDWAFYVGIDNVQISSPFNNDITVRKIVTPISGCGLSNSEPITVQVNNIGSTTVNGFNIVFDVDNGAQLFTETVNSTIVPGDSLNYTFTAMVDLSTIKQYSISTYTNFTGDENRSNDSINTIIEKESTIIPSFIDNFESTNFWKVLGTNPSWELGIPSGMIINTTTSGTKAFVTNLTGNYNNNESSYLVSPCFNFSSNSGDPFVLFDINYNMELGFDSLSFESSIDNGVSWQVVSPDTNAINWFNSPTSWQGSSNGWITAENRLTGLVGQSQVIFRFKFQSDGSGAFEGVGIDNFSIRYPQPIDFSIKQLINPINSNNTLCKLPNNSNIVIEIENKGLNPIDTTLLFYQVDNGTIFTDTFISLIPPNSIQNFTFSNTFDFSAVRNYNLNVWGSVNGDTFNANDSLLNQTIINANTIPADTLPFFEDFETFTPGTGGDNTGSSMANGWTRTSNTNFHWGARTGTTPSFGTGPDDDHTAAPGNTYIYTEASGTFPGTTTTLESPCIDLSSVQAAILEFWTHRFGAQMADLYVDVYDGNQWVNVQMLTTTPQLSDSSTFSLNIINLSSFTGRTIKIRFRTGTWIGFSSDMAIDDIRIYKPLPNDIQVNQLITPNSGCIPSGIVTVELENFGSTDITTPFPITLNVNNATAITDTVNFPILIGEKKNFSFATQPNFSAQGNYTLSITTFLGGDLNPLNDTLTKQIVNNLQPTSYTEDFSSFIDGECPQVFGSPSNTFDTLKSDWRIESIGGGSEWQVHDAGVCRTRTGFNTGPIVDHTTDSGKFMYVESSNGSGIAQLFTPCIDFSNDSIASMSFWYHAFGSHIGTLTVDVLANGVWNPLPGLSIVGQQQSNPNDPWLFITDTFNQFAGQDLSFRFSYDFSGGSNGFGDFAIDDVSFLDQVTGISKEKKQEQKLSSIYPNPNKGNFKLEVSSELLGKTYQILDLKGSVIKKSSITSTLSTIELNTIDQGVYLLRIEGISETKKIVIY